MDAAIFLTEVVVCYRHVADACNHTLTAYQVWLRTHVDDFQTGLFYLKMAVEFGHVPACLTLGKLFHDGANVERDAFPAICAVAHSHTLLLQFISRVPPPFSSFVSDYCVRRWLAVAVT